MAGDWSCEREGQGARATGTLKTILSDNADLLESYCRKTLVAKVLRDPFLSSEIPWRVPHPHPRCTGAGSLPGLLTKSLLAENRTHGALGAACSPGWAAHHLRCPCLSLPAQSPQNHPSSCSPREPWLLLLPQYKHHLHDTS